MPERNRGYLRKQRLRNIERRKKLISQRELMYHGYKTLNDPDFKVRIRTKWYSLVYRHLLKSIWSIILIKTFLN